MPFSGIDTSSVARALASLAQRPDDLVEAYFERQEEVELPACGEAPGIRWRREEGLAVRLVRGERSWFSSRDAIAPHLLEDALRQVARVHPRASCPVRRLEIAPPRAPDRLEELVEFPQLVKRSIRSRHAVFPGRMILRRHRRDLQVVGPRLVAEPQHELFYSFVVDLSWVRHGGLLDSLDEEAADRVAEHLTAHLRAHYASPPEPGSTSVVLGPGACAVFLHEAVAHALEVDTLALGGRPEAAIGARLGPSVLSVLDDPSAAPDGLRRSSDDEGAKVLRRWLLREGVVEQPLADLRWAASSERLTPGAARRGGRHVAPEPRSTFLELLPGDLGQEELLSGAGDGLFLPLANWGRLDPISGCFDLCLPFGQRIRGGTLAEPVGACLLRGRVAELLARVEAVGRDVELAGAGWCAKGAQKLPVWAATPELLLRGVEVLV